MIEIINYLKEHVNDEGDFLKVDMEYIPAIITALENQYNVHSCENCILNDTDACSYLNTRINACDDWIGECCEID